MDCPKCGWKNKNDAVVCLNCYFDLRSDVEPVPIPPRGAPAVPTPSASRTPAHMEHVDFWPRVGATLIDAIILGTVLFVVKRGFGLSAVMPGGDLGPVRASAVLAFSIAAVYTVGLNTVYGATVGKMALGIKIVKSDGSRITFGTALARYLLKRILAGVTCGLMYLSVAFNDQHRGWHDRIAGTTVIYN